MDVNNLLREFCSAVEQHEGHGSIFWRLQSSTRMTSCKSSASTIPALSSLRASWHDKKRKRAEPFRARPLISRRGQTISWPSPCSPVPPTHTVC
jgi:hypothetical protein